MDAVRQKIARSAEHFKAAEAEIQRYFDDKPGHVETETESNTNRIVVRFVVDKPVPPSFCIAVGDGLQNLRSSLDYLIWELVLAANGSPGYKNMFPICDTRESFNDQITRKRLVGVPPDAVTEIEGLQPYHNGQLVEHHLLRVLDSLCNINKHRRIILIAPAVHFSQTEFISSETGASVQTTLSPRYHGAEIAVSPSAFILGEEVEVKGDAAFFVTFNEGVTKDIEWSICVNQIWRSVYDTVLPKFDKFFV